ERRSSWARRSLAWYAESVGDQRVAVTRTRSPGAGRQGLHRSRSTSSSLVSQLSRPYRAHPGTATVGARADGAGVHVYTAAGSTVVRVFGIPVEYSACR